MRATWVVGGRCQPGEQKPPCWRGLSWLRSLFWTPHMGKSIFHFRKNKMMFLPGLRVSPACPEGGEHGGDTTEDSRSQEPRQTPSSPGPRLPAPRPSPLPCLCPSTSEPQRLCSCFKTF